MEDEAARGDERGPIAIAARIALARAGRHGPRERSMREIDCHEPAHGGPVARDAVMFEHDAAVERMDPIAVSGAAAREQPPQSAQRGAAAERAHVRAAAGGSLGHLLELDDVDAVLYRHDQELTNGIRSWPPTSSRHRL
jgi:hypothetical protein